MPTFKEERQAFNRVCLTYHVMWFFVGLCSCGLGWLGWAVWYALCMQALKDQLRRNGRHYT